MPNPNTGGHRSLIEFLQESSDDLERLGDEYPLAMAIAQVINQPMNVLIGGNSMYQAAMDGDGLGVSAGAISMLPGGRFANKAVGFGTKRAIRHMTTNPLTGGRAVPTIPALRDGAQTIAREAGVGAQAMDMFEGSRDQASMALDDWSFWR